MGIPVRAERRRGIVTPDMIGGDANPIHSPISPPDIATVCDRMPPKARNLGLSEGHGSARAEDLDEEWIAP